MGAATWVFDQHKKLNIRSHRENMFSNPYWMIIQKYIKLYPSWFSDRIQKKPIVKDHQQNMKRQVSIETAQWS